MTPAAAAKLAPAPTWADQPDYERLATPNGDRGDVLVFDRAVIIEDPFVTVGVEWQTDVAADGTVGRPLESLKVVTGDETAFIESAHLSHVVFVICHAAIKAGVKL
ncbi:hypothetical protein [Microbacterium testaceum]|uniref:hypothetical protein n=1 Tax=Microbacterium testaceum TaxID=2033 RepID=UPI0022DF3AC8|nr:hypothetical protein [Microbacterium testaceum]